MGEITKRTPGLSLADLRENYGRSGLVEADCETNPLDQFVKWFHEAQVADSKEPNAMTLATVDGSGQPSARVVLLKALDHGFVFYTNYQSRKAEDVKTNPRVAATFFWVELERQVRVEGTVGFVSQNESEAYFRQRPRGSQIGAWVSTQSAGLASRAELEATLKDVEARFEGVEQVPMPGHWGGYRVIPHAIEFWQGRPNRLHDRIRYEKGPGDTWVMERLWP
jgi:pyridoxamine 5'-phosphate oxidase